MANSYPKNPHAVVIPYPLQGHINPAIHLAIKLASRGFTITFVNTEAIHHSTSLARQTAAGSHDDVFAGARASNLDIRYELVSDGLPVGFDRSLNHDQFMYSVLHVISAHVEDLLVRRLSGASPPVSCLIADTFFVWPDILSKKLGIPYVSFWTEPALVFTLYYHMDLLIKHGHFASQENRKDTITYIPGVPAIEPNDLMSYLQDTDISSVVHQIIFKAFEQAKGADFILCNTVQELEHDTITALQLKKPFYAIGPVFLTIPTKTPVSISFWAESDCIHWLCSKPPGSVLYVSFGSYAHVNKRDLEEIANGILESKVNFIWVLRPDIVSSDEPDPLPTGFEEATRGLGIVVPWCSQIEVLSHGSTGGFLTHCGWNSIMECIWCEIPMLCFPLLTDQLTNKKLVVKDWRIGLDIGQSSDADRRVVSKGIVSLMGGGAREEIRKEIKEVRRKLETAFAVEGSSQKNFEHFIEDLSSCVSKGGKGS